MKKIFLILCLLLSAGVLTTFIYSITVEEKQFKDAEMEFIKQKEIVDSEIGSLERFTITQKNYRERQELRYKITFGMLIATVFTVLFRLLISIIDDYKRYRDTKLAMASELLTLGLVVLFIIFALIIKWENIPRIYLRFALPVLIALNLFLDSIGIMFTEKNIELNVE